MSIRQNGSGRGPEAGAQEQSLVML